MQPYEYDLVFLSRVQNVIVHADGSVATGDAELAGKATACGRQADGRDAVLVYGPDRRKGRAELKILQRQRGPKEYASLWIEQFYYPNGHIGEHGIVPENKPLSLSNFTPDWCANSN